MSRRDSSIAWLLLLYLALAFRKCHGFVLISPSAGHLASKTALHIKNPVKVLWERWETTKAPLLTLPQDDQEKEERAQELLVQQSKFKYDFEAYDGFLKGLPWLDQKNFKRLLPQKIVDAISKIPNVDITNPVLVDQPKKIWYVQFLAAASQKDLLVDILALTVKLCQRRKGSDDGFDIDDLNPINIVDKLQDLWEFSDDDIDAIAEDLVVEGTKLADKISAKEKSEEQKTIDSIDDYVDIFDEGRQPLSVKDYLLFRDKDFDSAFNFYRIAGPHALALRKCTDEVLKKFAALGDAEYDSLRSVVKAAQAKGELFCTDFSLFDGVAGSKYSENKVEYTKYVSPAIALFVVTDEEQRVREPLKCVAIQLELAKLGQPKPPIFTPPDYEKVAADFDKDTPSALWTWFIAKACYTAADGTYHEAVSHLAESHLVAEAFIPAIHAQLHESHPLYHLLIAHIEGTAHINSLADTLLKETGVFKLVGPENKQAVGLSKTSALNRLKQSFSFPADLQRQGITKKDFGHLYPYRDDAQLHWDALFKWISSYLRHFYPSEDKLKNDNELNAWIAQLVSKDGGNVEWLKSWYTTDKKLDLLIEVVTSLIFSVSVRHASVNFPQKEIMSFEYAYNLAIFNSPPKDKTPKTRTEFLKYLAPIELSKFQKQIAYNLGGVYYTQLGQYEKNYFGDPEIRSSLKVFQNELKEIEKKINARNDEQRNLWRKAGYSKEKAELREYKVLLPTRIPQSTNI